MSERSTQILISKVAAAQRQIDAAVRMTLAGEDKLAVYTVTAAALKICRDLMRTRGKSFVADRHLYINVGLARQLLRNEPSEVLDYIREHNPSHYETLESIAEAIRNAELSGRRAQAEDLFKISVSSDVEAEYRLEYDEPANFLKHADRDPYGHWQEDKIDSDQVLFDACDAYLSVMRRVTPEMLVYMTLWLLERRIGKVGDDQDSFPGPMRPVTAIFEGVEPTERRSACLNMLREQRDILNNLLRLYEPGRGRTPDVGMQQSQKPSTCGAGGTKARH